MGINYIVRKELYKERKELIQKAVQCKPVSRIPLVYIGMAFSPKYMGVKMSDFVSKPKLQVEVFYNTLMKLEKIGGIDGLNVPPMGVEIEYMFAALWMQRTRLPGKDLPDDSLWQLDEKETMKIDDYDYILKNGWKKFVSIYNKRIGYTKIKQLKTMYTALSTGPKALKGFKDAGWPVLNGGQATIPFEPLCGARSMEKFFFDLYRMPDKIGDVMDVMLPDLIAGVKTYVNLTKPMGAWVGGWRSASGMIGPKQWNRFVFPYFKKVVQGVADLGIAPILHLDQDWTRDLARFKELPAKTCIMNLDGMTDIRKAKEILGDHMAIMGDVPSSLFAAGTPDDIYKYVRELIRDVGPRGLILAPGCDAPINTKPENMEAFIAAAKEYGETAG